MRAFERFGALYGPWALVAGASEGIGAEFSRQIAELGTNVFMVAEKAEPLTKLAATIARTTGVATRALVVDLAERDFLASLAPELRGLDVGLLVCNAAVATTGPFLDQSPADLERTIAVNCRAPTLLVRELAPAMVRRGRGGIVLMSSVAGVVGTPMVAAYAATKAFDLVLGEGLAEELAEAGVDVLAWCPGETDTPGRQSAGLKPPGALEPPLMAPAAVVRDALATLGRRPSGVAGRANQAAALVLHRLLPRRLAVRLTGRAMRRRFSS